jgi:hypothetical protein
VSTKKKSVVEFGDPPSKRESLYDWVAVARALRAKPGEWARVFEGGKVSTATAVKAGAIQAFRPISEWEFRTENNTRTNPRTCDLWMRHVPSKEK